MAAADLGPTLIERLLSAGRELPRDQAETWAPAQGRHDGTGGPAAFAT